MEKINAHLPDAVLKAVVKDDAAAVEAWLDAGGDIETTAETRTVKGMRFSGVTMLMGASAANRLELVELLLRRGAKLDAQSYHGSTALMAAAMNGYAVVVRTLLKAGASTGLRDSRGNTALKMAQDRKHTAVVAEFRAHEQRQQNAADATIAAGAAVAAEVESPLWPVGTIIEALDCRNMWCAAKVLKVRGQGLNHEVYVHYIGWNAKWNEWHRSHGHKLRAKESDAAVGDMRNLMADMRKVCTLLIQMAEGMKRMHPELFDQVHDCV